MTSYQGRCYLHVVMYVSVLLPFKTTCILSLVLFLVLFQTSGFGVSSYIFCCSASSIWPELDYPSFPNSLLCIYHRVYTAFSFKPFKGFPFNALCSLVCSVTLCSPFLKLKIAFLNSLPRLPCLLQHYPFETTVPFLILCSFWPVHIHKILVICQASCWWFYGFSK